ncbi:MAG: proline dehydrogenase family protein [Candidatus Marinimicrobia bacterium]|nr:proline dehydrogenase family protein [Candidatus Neomarinimicrobiota bacterium]
MLKKIINYIILGVTPHLPLSTVKKFAGRYVAGEKINEALRVIAELNANGYSATIDILGEHTISKVEAELITSRYLRIYEEIARQNLDCNISIKPSHIGGDVGDNFLNSQLDILLKKAKDTNNFLRIDMESSDSTDTTIQQYLRLRKVYNGVGTVFQAYLYRTEEDLSELSKNGSFNFRLCKGIYKEPERIAIQSRRNINSNFLKLLQLAFENNIYVGIATHDLLLLEESYKLIEKYQVQKDRFEFQVLYGVPMSGWLEKHKANGYKVRVYVPFGEDWYAYSIRRLKENPNIAGYVLKDFFRR